MMKGRRERQLAEAVEAYELDLAIRERFKTERHPEESVDGDDRWSRDLFEEE